MIMIGAFYMKKNMSLWADNLFINNKKKSLPILSFPGIQLMNKNVNELVNDGNLQANCMKIIADRYENMLASVSLMDLSVEAEAFGSQIRYEKNEVPTVVGSIVNNLEDAKGLKVPEVGEKRTKECINAIKYATNLIKDRPIFAGVIGPFSLAGRLMDMTEIMIKCYVDPETVKIVLEKVTDFIIEYIKALKQSGANGVIIAEPAAGLLSPELMAEFSNLYIKKIKLATEEDDFLLIYHNCGNINQLIDEILKLDFRIIHVGNNANIENLLEKVPQNILLMGNISPAEYFKDENVEKIINKTKEMLEKYDKYNNYYISSGCDIPPTSSLKNIDAYFDVISQFYDKKY